MMSELTRLHDEAARLLNLYEKYKDSDDLQMRRKVHIRFDRFLMEHRDAVAILVVEGLHREIELLKAAPPAPTKVPWWKRMKGGKAHASNKSKLSQ